VKRKKLYLQYGAGIIVALLLAALPATGAQTYQASGLVVKVSPEHNEFVVSMQELPGYMDAMVMSLPVHQSRDLQGLHPGIMVDFKLVVSEKDSYAEDIRVRAFVCTENDPQAAARLAILQEILAGNSPSMAALAIGQHVPDFSLTDQNRQQVALSQFSGKVVAMTFVYASCPLPNFCYRLSNNFGQLQKRFGNRMGQDLILLTITLDPDHDQPEALAKYGSIWKANGVWWHLLTGPVPAIKRVTSMFGVVFNPDMGVVTHSLHTVIIDRQGNLADNLEGNEFTAKQLGDLVEVELNRASGATGTERADAAAHELTPGANGVKK
jgi:protein SCO1/2